MATTWILNRVLAHFTLSHFDSWLEIAKDNAKKIGLNIDFQVADAWTLEPINDNEYDIVYATYIGWYQNIEMAFKNWLRVLKPGGRLLYVGSYPATVSRSYYDRTPDYYVFDATPAGRRYGVNINIQTVNFHHTLSDIVNAIAKAGFRIEQMIESGLRNDISHLSIPDDIAIIATKPAG